MQTFFIVHYITPSYLSKRCNLLIRVNEKNPGVVLLVLLYTGAQTLSSTLCPHLLLYFSLPIVLILSLLQTGLSSNRQGGEL